MVLSRTVRLVLAATCMVAAASRSAAGQAQTIAGSVVTSVNVLFPPLTGVGIHALDFGMILPGTSAVTVNPQTNSGGEFRILGTKARKSVDISFALPSALTGAGGATIPLSFNGNFAALCEVDESTGVCVAASYTTWNPVTTPSFHDTPQRYQPGRKTYTYNEYAVYLGGLASPAGSQQPGHYTGTASVTIVIN